MAVNYLHGVETLELNIGPRPVRVVKSAVIGLVGCAPYGPRNQLVLVQSQSQAAAFGPKMDGFTIPKALDAIQKQGAGTVVVINVFDPTTNTTQVTDEAQTVTNGKFVLDYQPLLDLGVSVTLAGNPVALNTDFTLDDFGNGQIVSGGALSEGDDIEVTYKYFAANTVTNSQLIGTITSGVRKGSKLFEECFATFGFKPRLFICPEYITQNAIAVEWIALAEQYKGHCIIDAPKAKTPTEVITARGPLGTLNFNTSSKRAILTYPYFKVYNEDTGFEELAPASQFWAGVIAATDNTDGYWFSPSNREVKGIIGVERTITGSINDASTEANLLNENGICTYLNSFGTGLRTWGNRSAAWPTNTAPENFISVQRTADILHESVELAMLPFLDKPITDALIDSIRASVNGFINSLIQRGALVDGVCEYDPDNNPPTQIALGQLVFNINFMPPTPAERITFLSYIDINLLASLGTNN